MTKNIKEIFGEEPKHMFEVALKSLEHKVPKKDIDYVLEYIYLKQPELIYKVTVYFIVLCAWLKKSVENKKVEPEPLKHGLRMMIRTRMTSENLVMWIRQAVLPHVDNHHKDEIDELVKGGDESEIVISDALKTFCCQEYH